MNVILGCKGLKDCFPQLSDVFYVEIYDFIDIFMHRCQYYGPTKQS